MGQEVRRLLGKGIHHYGLIEDGDRIAVGVSGGKDSMLLLWLLRERLRRVPISYELIAVHIDPGFDTESADRLEAFFRKEGFRYEIIRTDHGPRAHGVENRENPCFLCARLRRSALFNKASELGCPKIALGHNQDDLIETFFINICYGAQVSAHGAETGIFRRRNNRDKAFCAGAFAEHIEGMQGPRFACRADKVPFGRQKPQD